jgi:hypothetical protein
MSMHTCLKSKTRFSHLSPALDCVYVCVCVCVCACVCVRVCVCAARTQPDGAQFTFCSVTLSLSLSLSLFLSPFLSLLIFLFLSLSPSPSHPLSLRLFQRRLSHRRAETQRGLCVAESFLRPPSKSHLLVLLRECVLVMEAVMTVAHDHDEEDGGKRKEDGDGDGVVVPYEHDRQLPIQSGQISPTQVPELRSIRELNICIP